MADPKGFLKIRRKNSEYRPVCERIKDYREVVSLSSERHSQEQASRCMDCGTPFCHWACPIGNYIPEWNDLMFNGHWQRAFELLQATNNFPEISGRICPAICEFACVLGINDDPVTIRENELSVIEYAFKKDLLKPRPIRRRSGKKVAIVGSGPAGLACADQLNKAGHSVVVFEKDDRIGGILRYGIPDFKLEKRILDRRLKILQKEGIEFNPNVNVGIDLRTSKLKKEFDAICLAGGCGVARNLNIEGRNLKGIYFAMDYLTQANRRVLGQKVAADKIIDAKGKQVVIIGGGDTGADCVGTAHRQGAACVVQIELLPRPPECRSETMPWPQYPLILKTSTSHQEGGVRYWSVLTKRFIGNKGRVKKILCVKVDFSERDQRGCAIMREVAGSEFEIEADLVILAIGFLHPQHQGLLKELGIELDRRGNVKTDKNYMASIQGVFSAGDMRRGQSLVVWAIYEGRQAARSIDKYLMGKTFLPKI
jgi:glutamate synthase (NADPH/NADH) small chain